jgi:hypothetical protein
MTFTEEGENHISESLQSLLGLTSKTFCYVRYQYLDPLMVLIDPDFGIPVPIVSTTFRVIHDLLSDRCTHDVEYFARSHSVELIWKWIHQIPFTSLCLHILLEEHVGVVEIVWENGLIEKLIEFSRTTIDSGLNFLSVLFRSRPELFGPEIISDLSHGGKDFSHSNLSGSYLGTLNELIRQFPECLRNLMQFVVRCPRFCENDITIRPVLKIFEIILKMSRNFELVILPTVLPFIVSLLHSGSVWTPKVLRLLNIAMEITPLINQMELLKMVMTIVASDGKFEVRCLALQYVLEIGCHSTDPVRGQIIEAGIFEFVTVCLEVLSLPGQIKARHFLNASKSADPDLSFDDQLMSAIQRVAANGGKETGLLREQLSHIGDGY